MALLRLDPCIVVSWLCWVRLLRKVGARINRFGELEFGSLWVFIWLGVWLDKHLNLAIYHKIEATSAISFLIKKFVLLQVDYFLVEHELRKHRFIIVTEVLLILLRISRIKELLHKFCVIYLVLLNFHLVRLLIGKQLLIIILELFEVVANLLEPDFPHLLDLK